eukprot:3537635-Rhodomonas_salina.1
MGRWHLRCPSAKWVGFASDLRPLESETMEPSCSKQPADSSQQSAASPECCDLQREFLFVRLRGLYPLPPRPVPTEQLRARTFGRHADCIRFQVRRVTLRVTKVVADPKKTH